MSRKPLLQALRLLISASFISSSALAGSFFSMSSIEYDAGSHQTTTSSHTTMLKIRVATAEATRADQIFAKAYIYDPTGKMLASFTHPSDVPRAGADHYAMPAIFQKQKAEDLYFVIPGDLVGKQWTAVAVFGDANEAVAKTYGGTLSPLIQYPEKKIVENRTGGTIERKAAIDPLVETLITMPGQQHQQMTMFYRMPDGVGRVADVKGTLAMCLLADNVGSIRRQLQGISPGKEVNGLLKYANEHKLGVLCWGHQRLVNPLNSPARAREADDLARAWERGVADLHTKYSIPVSNYLVWGVCQAAESTCQLVLRKPDYFLGVFIHIPPHLEVPTQQSSKVLWLLTSGEMDAGYQHCIEFYRQTRALNYPIIFKPIAGLGHSDSPVSYNLAYRFFDYALTLQAERAAYDQLLKDPLSQMRLRNATSTTWASKFQSPEYYGDYLNQECHVASQASLIPAALRVPLPTKELADLWSK